MDTFEEDTHPWDDDPGEPVDGLPMVDPVTGKKILRPRNAWILYRNARLDDVERLQDGVRQPMASASKVISRWWRAEAKEVRAMYELQAEREKAEHRRKYPHYKFQPKSKAQKRLEQAAKKAAKKKTTLAAKKSRARGMTPPVFSSTQTSYVAACIAQQAASTSALAPALSPPLSLASTPLNGPSPLSSSDHESSSYSTSATSPISASPASALGLGLLPPMSFSGQDAATARVPQHSPARLPPRPKGQRHSSSSTATSRVPSSSTITPPSPPDTSPASSSAHMLSPLPWPPMQQQPSPEPEGNSPPTLPAVAEESSATLDAWLNESAYEPIAIPDTSGAVSIELDFPPSFDLNEFTEFFDPNHLPPLDNTDSQGLFQVPADSFRQSAPGQIDVSLGNMQQPSNVSSEEREAFSMLLETFDFGSMENDADAMQATQEMYSDYLPQPAAGNDAWGNFSGMDATLLPGTINADQLLASYASQEAEVQSLEQSDNTPTDFGNNSNQTGVQQQMQPPPQVPPRQAQQPPPEYAFDIPPELAQNPLFQDWFSRIASPQQPAPAQPALFPVPPPTQHLSQQQYAQEDPSPYRERTSSLQIIPPSPQSSHSAPNPSHPHTSDESTAPYAFVPPPGANRTNSRRVAGSWRPPLPPPQSNPWSLPMTPRDAPSQMPSWGGASS